MDTQQTDEQEQRRQQKISLERFLTNKRLRDANRTSREGFRGPPNTRRMNGRDLLETL